MADFWKIQQLEAELQRLRENTERSEEEEAELLAAIEEEQRKLDNIYGT